MLVGKGTEYSSLQLAFSVLSIACLFVLPASPLILFFHFFFSYLLPYLSFLLRIDPLRFQAGCRKS